MRAQPWSDARAPRFVAGRTSGILTGTLGDFFQRMNGFFIGLIAVFFVFVILVAVWSRWRRQMGGGWGPSEFSDGHMTTTPTGYPEEMHGGGKTIAPADNDAAKM